MSMSTPRPISERTEVPESFVVAVDGSDASIRALAVATAFAGAFGASVQITHGEPGDLPFDELRRGTPHLLVCVGATCDDVLETTSPTAWQVLVDARLPVLFVGPHCSLPPVLNGPIVVGYDGSHASAAVFPIARTWARHLDVPIVLAHTWGGSDPFTSDLPGGSVRDAVRRLGPSARFEAVRTAYPAGAVRDLAHELDASLVVMATHGQTASADVVAGHVATRVTRESGCPVLVRRPSALAHH